MFFYLKRVINFDFVTEFSFNEVLKLISNLNQSTNERERDDD